MRTFNTFSQLEVSYYDNQSRCARAAVIEAKN